MSRALAFAVLLLAAAVVAPLACADGVESIPGAKESASAGSSGAKVFDTDTAVGPDPDPSPASGLPADPAPDARP